VRVTRLYMPLTLIGGWCRVIELGAGSPRRKGSRMLLSKVQLRAGDAASVDPARGSLLGMLLEADGTCVGTDGHALIAVGPANGDGKAIDLSADYPRPAGKPEGWAAVA